MVIIETSPTLIDVFKNVKKVSILAGMREGWKASLLFSADDFMTEFRASITSSISFVELKDWIMSGLVMSAKALLRLMRKRGISQY